MNALKTVLRIVYSAGKGAIQDKRLCVVIWLNVKNTLNSGSWNLIDTVFQKSTFHAYLVRTIMSYTTYRWIEIGRNWAAKAEISHFLWDPKRSVLKLTLYNLFYDDILRLPVLIEVKLIAFEDDVVLVETARDANNLDQLVNPFLAYIEEWMAENSLSLAPIKSECIILTMKRAYRIPALIIDSCQISVKCVIRYLRA